MASESVAATRSVGSTRSPGAPERAARWEPGHAGARAIVLAATLIALLLRLFRLGAQPLWLDEAYTSDAARIVHDTGPMGVAAFDHIAPVYYWLAALTTAVGGPSEFWLRLPSALAGAVCVPLAYHVAAELAGRRAVGVGAAVITAVSPYTLWYGQEARSYEVLLALAFGYALVHWRLLHDGVTLRRLVAIAVLGAAMLWVHHVGVFLMGAAGLVALLHWGLRDGRFWRWLAAHVVALAAFAPWLVITSGKLADTVSPEKPSPLLWVPYSVLNFVAGQSFGPPIREIRETGAGAAVRAHLPELVLFGLAVVLLALAVAPVLARWGRLRLTWLVSWAVVPVVLLIVATYVVHMAYNTRYIMVCFPVLAVLGGVAFAEAMDRRVVAVLAVVALLLVSVWADGLWLISRSYAKDDLRSVQAELAREMRPDDVLVIANTSAIPPLEAYGFSCPAKAMEIWDDRALGALTAGTGPGRTFVVENRQWEVVSTDDLRARLGDVVGAPAQTQDWAGSSLTVYDRPLTVAAAPGLGVGCER